MRSHTEDGITNRDPVSGPSKGERGMSERADGFALGLFAHTLSDTSGLLPCSEPWRAAVCD